MARLLGFLLFTAASLLCVSPQLAPVVPFLNPVARFITRLWGVGLAVGLVGMFLLGGWLLVAGTVPFPINGSFTRWLLDRTRTALKAFAGLLMRLRFWRKKQTPLPWFSVGRTIPPRPPGPRHAGAGYPIYRFNRTTWRWESHGYED